MTVIQLLSAQYQTVKRVMVIDINLELSLIVNFKLLINHTRNPNFKSD